MKHKFSNNNDGWQVAKSQPSCECYKQARADYDQEVSKSSVYSKPKSNGFIYTCTCAEKHNAKREAQKPKPQHKWSGKVIGINPKLRVDIPAYSKPAPKPVKPSDTAAVAFIREERELYIGRIAKARVELKMKPYTERYLISRTLDELAGLADKHEDTITARERKSKRLIMNQGVGESRVDTSKGWR